MFIQSSPESADYGGCVRVVTWNVWWRFGEWEPRQEAILRTLRDLAPDIVCLQEVWSAEDGEDQVSNFASQLGMFHARTPERWWNGYSFGNAIMSKYQITDTESIQLPPTEGPGTRWALSVILDRGDIHVPVICTHLDHRFDQSQRRQKQVQAIFDLVAANHTLEGHPVVLAGDFNSTPNSDEIRMITGEAPTPVPGLAMTDAWPQCNDSPGWTWDKANPYLTAAAWPQRRLDYVFISWPRSTPLGNISSAFLAGIEPVNGVTPSDHWAVVVDLVEFGSGDI